MLAFEAPGPGSPDPPIAERFSAHRPLDGVREYVASMDAVPEPGTALGAPVGAGLLTALAKWRRRVAA